MEKKNQKISKFQKEKLVEFMASNLEFARGQFGTINSNINYKDQWESLSVYLNSLGGSDKTTEQWKKCWIDLKAAVKKHISSRRSAMMRTGGGSYMELPRDLNPLEEQILNIITVDAVDGDSRTPESGLQSDAVEETRSATVDESMLSIEILDEDEVRTPQPKKRNAPTTSGASKYNDAIKEAREMQAQVMAKLEKIERQNKLILEKLSQIIVD